MQELTFEVWGDFACFTMPYGKVERLTYPLPTPSAARGIISAIYCKPKEFYWQIRRIEVLRPIRYISFKRNEVKSKVSDKPIFTDEDRTQRQTVALKDVRYRISASIIPREAFVGEEKALYEQAHRRLKNGKCFMQPSLGLREFVAYVEEYDPAVHLDKPIPVDMDLGLMIYDVFDLHDDAVRKKTQTKLSLFHAVMRQGVLNIPEYDSPEVIKEVSSC